MNMKPFYFRVLWRKNFRSSSWNRKRRKRMATPAIRWSSNLRWVQSPQLTTSRTIQAVTSHWTPLKHHTLALPEASLVVHRVGSINFASCFFLWCMWASMWAIGTTTCPNPHHRPQYLKLLYSSRIKTIVRLLLLIMSNIPCSMVILIGNSATYQYLQTYNFKTIYITFAFLVLFHSIWWTSPMLLTFHILQILIHFMSMLENPAYSQFLSIATFPVHSIPLHSSNIHSVLILFIPIL